MLNPEECEAVLKFLDRTPITGHGERSAMNIVTKKLYKMSLLKTDKEEISKSPKYPNSGRGTNDDNRTDT